MVSSPQLHPIELPQFKHSNGKGGAGSQETPEKQGQEACPGPAGATTEGDAKSPIETHGSIGGDIVRQDADPIAAALARALDRATSDEAILAVLRAIEARQKRGTT
jgi:hypothetical protein